MIKSSLLLSSSKLILTRTAARTKTLIYSQPTLFTAAAAASSAIGISMALFQTKRHFSTLPSQFSAEEASSLPYYQGTPPEEDDTHRFILRENPLRSIWKDDMKDVRDLDITLYQYQVCPFCCKVRTFLDYHKIPYKIVEVDPIMKTEIKFSKVYKKVPIILVNGIQINDSSLIISSLSDLMRSPKETSNNEEVVKWRKWVDHTLVHTLPPNIYRSVDEAMEAFEYISTMNNFSWYQKQAAKYVGSMAMWAVSKKLKKKHNIDDEREAIFSCANQWTEQALNNGKKLFHGGNRPDLADLAVYGVLSSIEGLRTFNEMLEATSIGAWYYRVKKEVGECFGKR
jgi:microsomal prostaglandin-E synthase 2